MKNQISAVLTAFALLAGFVVVALLFRQLMDLLFNQPAGWQVWLLLGLAVFAIEQLSALFGGRQQRRRGVPATIVLRGRH